MPWLLQNINNILHTSSVEWKMITLPKATSTAVWLQQMICTLSEIFFQGFFSANVKSRKKRKKKLLLRSLWKGVKFLILHLLTFYFIQSSEIGYWSCIINLPPGSTQLSEGFSLMSQTSEDVFHVCKGIGCLILYI